MVKAEFDMLYFNMCWEGGGMIFSFDKSTSLERGSQKKPWDDQGGLPKNESKK